MKELLYSLKVASPESRFFVLLWWNHFGCQKSWSYKVADLSSCLGVTKTVVTNATKYLCQAGFLEKDSVSNYARAGKPTAEYVFTDPMMQLFADIETYKFHEDLISELLDIRRGNELHKNLKLANRLLLTVLMLQADEFGFIKELGFAQVQALTGMSRDQFNSQVVKLTKLKYLEVIAKGTTSKVLLGARGSIYRLNVTDTSFKRALYSEFVSPPIFFESSEVMGSLIQMSISCSNAYTIAEQEKEQVRKQRANEIYKNTLSKFVLAFGEISVSSISLLLELHRNKRLTNLLLELIFICVSSNRLLNVKNTKKSIEKWKSALESTLTAELEPKFEKQRSEGSSGFIEPKVSLAMEEEHGEKEDFTFDCETYSPLNAKDLGVLSEVLVNEIAYLYANKVDTQISIVEKELRITVKGAYSIPVDNQRNNARQVVLFYPKSQRILEVGNHLEETLEQVAEMI